jgi:two-component system sensor histidine kinase UhpB
VSQRIPPISEKVPGSERHDAAGRLRRFALRRIVERELERRRIAQTLHDDLGQTLSALNLGLYRIACRFAADPQHLALVDEARALLEDAARCARRLAAGFRPCAAEPGSLQTVLSSTVERFQAEFGRQCLTMAGRDANVSLDQGNAMAVQSLLLRGLAATARYGLAKLPVIHAECGDILALEIREHARTAPEEARASPSAAPDDVQAELEDLREWLHALGGDLSLGAAEDRFVLRIELPLPD